MIGQLAAIATAFCWSATAVFFSYSGRRIGSAVVNRSRLLFALMAVQLARLGIASTLMSLPPVILVPVEYVVYRTRVSWRGILGTAAALCGVALIFRA